MTGHWGPLLVGQLEFYGDVHLRPRLEGLGDEEYLWEPVEGCWSLRRDENGVYALDGRWLEPSPPPVTTIAWRMVHLGATCLANRASAFFGDGNVAADADMFDPLSWLRCASMQRYAYIVAWMHNVARTGPLPVIDCGWW